VILPGEGGLTGILFFVTELKIGYARVSTVDQDLTAQHEALAALGVDPIRIYVDHSLTGTNRDRPGFAPSPRRLPQRRHARRDKA
jgi:Resolvase, N terminal domain